jgi:hypothetical protein
MLARSALLAAKTESWDTSSLNLREPVNFQRFGTAATNGDWSLSEKEEEEEEEEEENPLRAAGGRSAHTHSGLAKSLPRVNAAVRATGALANLESVTSGFQPAALHRQQPRTVITARGGGDANAPGGGGGANADGVRQGARTALGLVSPESPSALQTKVFDKSQRLLARLGSL